MGIEIPRVDSIRVIKGTRWTLKPTAQACLNMELTANTWYQFDGLFDAASVQLKDGSSIRTSDSQFNGSTLQALTGVVVVNHGRQADRQSSRCCRYLQLTLLDATRGDLDGLPQPLELSSRLLREHMLYLADSSYAYDVHIRNSEETYYSKGAVCVCLTLNDRYRSDRRLLQNSRDVQTAFQRGLLDEVGRSRAAFKLHIKPMMRKLMALRDSGYLPDNEWQVDVVFAHWYAEQTDQSAISPFDSEGANAVSSGEFEIQFKQQTHQRDLRISDLFSK